MGRNPKPLPRLRVGRVSVYEHHGAWWLSNRNGGRTERRGVAGTRAGAEQLAARVNAQLASDEPTLLTFTRIELAFPAHFALAKTGLRHEWSARCRSPRAWAPRAMRCPRRC